VAPDGTECATLSTDGDVRVFEIRDGGPLFAGKLKGQKEITGIAYSSNGQLHALFDGGAIGTLSRSGRPASEDPPTSIHIPLVGRGYGDTAMLTDDRQQTIVYGDSNGTLHAYDLLTGATTSTEIPKTASVVRHIVPLNIHGRESTLVLTDNGLFHCLSVAEQEARELITGHDYPWDTFTVSQDGSLLALAARQGLFVYSIDDQQKLRQVAAPHNFSGPASTCYGDDSGIVSLPEDGVLRLWSSAGQVIRQSDLPARLVSASPCPDKGSAIVGDVRGNVHFLTISDGKWSAKWTTQLNPRGLTPLLKIYGSTDFPVYARYFAEPDIVASTDVLGRLTLLRRSDGELLRWVGTLDVGSPRCCCYSRLFDAVVTAGSDVVFHQLSTLKTLQRLHYLERWDARDIQPVAGDRFLAIAGPRLHSLDGLGRLDPSAVFPVIHDSKFLFMAVSSDRRLVACSDQHDHILIFETETGKQIHSINCHRLVLSLAFESGTENYRLIAGLSDGRVCVWSLDQQ